MPKGASICYNDLSQCEVHTFLCKRHTIWIFWCPIYAHLDTWHVNCFVVFVVFVFCVFCVYWLQEWQWYWGKTDTPGNTTFRCMLLNVSPKYYAAGKAFYSARARLRVSKVVMLDRKNTLLKAYSYATLMMKDLCTDLVTILLRMLRSRRYGVKTVIFLIAQFCKINY